VDSRQTTIVKDVIVELLGVARSLIDDLREKIIVGELVPGQKINEIQLASALGISRSPLREALRVLENEHLIGSIPRKGSFVTGVSLDDLKEAYQIREMIECYAIDLLKEKQIVELPRVVSSTDKTSMLREPSESDSPKVKLAYITGMADYHNALIKSTGNSRLFQSYQTIHSSINRYIFLNAFREGSLQHKAEEHYQILECVQQKKYDQAKAVMRNHIRFSAEQLRIKMETRF
jgi:DNA-binding GntR family transcriptional regulator